MAGMGELPLPDPPLAGGGLALRPFEAGDVAAVTAACQDPEIPRWTHVPSPYREQDALQFFSYAAAAREAGRELHMAIVSADDDRLLGTIGLEAGVEPAIAEIGYWVAPEARGRGVATRAVALFSGWAIRELGIERVELLAHPENEASQLVARAAGFTREGLLRRYRRRKGRREDLLMFSLLADELGAA
jgi:RimJ/RimL family protein N-acetyltransferase